MNKTDKLAEFSKAEFAIKADKVELLKENLSRITDLFEVQIRLGVLSQQCGIQWVHIRGQSTKPIEAKAYIVALCDPQCVKDLLYPIEYDPQFRDPATRAKYEKDGVALIFQEGDVTSGQLRISGPDEASVCAAVSFFEDILNSDVDDPSSPIRSNDQLDSQLRKHISADGDLDLDDDVTKIPNTVKRSFLLGINDSRKLVEPSSATSDNDVIILDVEKRDIEPMEVDRDPEQRVRPAALSDDDFQRRCLRRHATFMGYSASEIDEVFQTRGSDFKSSDFIEALLIQRSRKLLRDVQGSLETPGDRRAAAILKTNETTKHNNDIPEALPVAGGGRNSDIPDAVPNSPSVINKHLPHQSSDPSINRFSPLPPKYYAMLDAEAETSTSAMLKAKEERMKHLLQQPDIFEETEQIQGGVAILHSRRDPLTSQQDGGDEVADEKAKPSTPRAKQRNKAKGKGNSPKKGGESKLKQKALKKKEAVSHAKHNDAAAKEGEKEAVESDLDEDIILAKKQSLETKAEEDNKRALLQKPETPPPEVVDLTDDDDSEWTLVPSKTGSGNNPVVKHRQRSPKGRSILGSPPRARSPRRHLAAGNMAASSGWSPPRGQRLPFGHRAPHTSHRHPFPGQMPRHPRPVAPHQHPAQRLPFNGGHFARANPPQVQGRYPGKAKRFIVIDGSNVAMAHGHNKVFSCKGIEIVVNYFRQRGHQNIIAMVPNSRRSVARDRPIRDQYLLEKLRDEEVLVFTPTRKIPGQGFIACHDDRFILRLAYEKNAAIVSNDNYRDLWMENTNWRPMIEASLLMFTFVGDFFMPPDDPLGRNGPILDEFLLDPVEIRDGKPVYKTTAEYGLADNDGGSYQNRPFPGNQQTTRPRQAPQQAAIRPLQHQTHQQRQQQQKPEVFQRTPEATEDLVKRLSEIFPRDLVVRVLDNHGDEQSFEKLAELIAAAM